ncbi:MAG TPA: hypothetical protein VJS43_18145 [Candidatus Acidoferrales bacterium]|nr:hypothetical protein [Candidatus Acidoferrales bacterium]
MRVRVKKPLWVAALAMSFAGIAPIPAAGQNLHNMVSSEGRVFPEVNGGIVAMREDSAGRLYILANPGHTLQIFDGNGSLLGQIPGPGSPLLKFSYAVDFDIAGDGDIVVADRGASTVYTFAPDGSLKSKASVFAPTSVVALSNGQIAVTTLRTEHPIEIFDENGRYVRGFGEPHVISNPSPDEDAAAPPPPLADTGRIIGDSTDNLYFAVLSPTNPQIKKFDRFGYAAFSTNVPFEADLPGGEEDRVQVGFNFTRLTASSQLGSWTTLGNTGRVRFGVNAGSGLASMMAHQDLTGTKTVAGSLTAETSLEAPSFKVGSGGTEGGSGSSGEGSSDQQGSGSGKSENSATLKYFAPGTFSSSSDFSSSNPDGTPAAASTPAVPIKDPTSIIPTTEDYLTGTPQVGPSTGAGVGGFSSYYLASLGPRPGGYQHTLIRPRELPPGSFGRGENGGGPGAGADAARPPAGATLGLATPGSLVTAPAASVTGAAPGSGGGATAGGNGTKPTFTRFGASDLAYVGSLRINLDHPRPPALTKKKLTAVGVDRQTQEFWAAIGPELVHFDKYGNAMDTYYMTTPEGALLQIAAIVVEPHRLLIGSSSGGIYDFARPDKMAVERSTQAGAKAEKNPTQ